MNTALRFNFNRTFSLIFSIALCFNFTIYSIQSYMPPSAHSLSYSALNCPSHSTQSPLSYIIIFLTKSEKENGSEKHCFCLPSNFPRSSFIASKSTSDVLTNEYITYLFPPNENLYLKGTFTNLLIRSPPLLRRIVLENL
jgi:hypothetical protein